MFKRILVPLDGSEFAERALPHAEYFARVFNSTIVLLHVMETTGAINQPHSEDPIAWKIKESKAKQYLEQKLIQVEKRLDNNHSKVEYAIRNGNPAESIIIFAQEEKINLLVISTHGWGGFSRWNISSVAQKVINRIYLPVLLIRAYEELETFEGKVNYRRILMPVDSSPRSECSFSAGLRLIRKERNKLISAESTVTIEPTLFIASVIRPPEIPIPEAHSEEAQKLINQLMRISRDSVHSYLERIKLQFSEHSETRILEHCSVSEALQRFVKDENIDLIIMAAHGHTGQCKYPYGSVAREMIEFGARPILIIQDIPPHLVKPSDSEIATKKAKGRK